MKKKAYEVFMANPKADKVYFTSDGMPFLKDRASENHQRSINSSSQDKKKVEVYDRKIVAEMDKAAEKVTQELIALRSEAKALKVENIEGMTAKELTAAIANAKEK